MAVFSGAIVKHFRDTFNDDKLIGVLVVVSLGSTCITIGAFAFIIIARWAA